MIFAAFASAFGKADVPAESWPGFQYTDRQPVRRHPQRDERPGRSSADDEHIKRACEVAGKGVTGHSDTIPKRRTWAQLQCQGAYAQPRYHSGLSG